MSRVEHDLERSEQGSTLSEGINILAIAESVLRKEAAALLSVVERLDEQFQLAASHMAKHQGHVVVSGLGKSGIVGQKISSTLSSTGTPSYFVHPSEAVHGDLGTIKKDDYVLLISNSGETEEVVALSSILRRNGNTLISLTADRDCTLARLADFKLTIGRTIEACLYNLAPTSSAVATVGLGDALAVAVCKLRGFTADDYGKRHPGGRLGKLLLPVTDILRFRVGHNVGVVSESETITSLLITEGDRIKKSGVFVLVDENRRLSGVLTDADLRRALARFGEETLHLGVATVMSRNPHWLTSTSTVADAVQLITKYRLDEVPIVDLDHHPIGVLDVQDLISLRLIHEDVESCGAS